MFILMKFLLIFLSKLLMFLDAPHRLALVLISSTFLGAMSVSLVSATAWPGFIIFLVFIGGILVLYAYVASLLASFISESLNKMAMMMLSFILFILCLFMDKNFKVSFFTEAQETPTKLFFLASSFVSSWSFLFLFSLLLITLFFLTLAMKVPAGAMRSMAGNN
uniref:NADH dehydrogenase subunit 6 n=1 Tax=Janira maculosa TaxID=155701 RepID=E3SXA7_9CRUS|nr:NADH dehydrogenase subunit 6 [Janira maculosa]